MRRFTSREKFCTLRLRNDSSLFAISTRRSAWGLPPFSHAKFVPLIVKKATHTYVCLESTFFVEWVSGTSHVWDCDLLTIPELRHDEGKFSPIDGWAAPEDWPAGMLMSHAHFLRPAAEPHCAYYSIYQDQQIHRFDFRTSACTIADAEFPRFPTASWSITRPLLDSTGLLLVGHRQALWQYSYQKRAIEHVQFRMQSYFDHYVAAGWDRVLLTSAGALVVRSLREGEIVVRLDPPKDRAVEFALMLPGGRQALTANHDRSVTWWDIEAGHEKQSWDWNVGKPLALAVLPDGMMAAVSGNNHHVVLWDLEG